MAELEFLKVKYSCKCSSWCEASKEANSWEQLQATLAHYPNVCPFCYSTLESAPRKLLVKIFYESDRNEHDYEGYDFINLDELKELLK